MRHKSALADTLQADTPYHHEVCLVHEELQTSVDGLELIIYQLQRSFHLRRQRQSIRVYDNTQTNVGLLFSGEDS